MNTIHHINNQAELEQLIDRYFDGETTVQEEQVLREALADCPWSSELIDEARFTMGYFAAHRQQQQHHTGKRANRFRMVAAAASVALLLSVGIGILWHQQKSDDMCIAYVDGKVINNDDAVMALIANDLNTMDDASQSMEAQLASIGEALELDN